MRKTSATEASKPNLNLVNNHEVSVLKLRDRQSVVDKATEKKEVFEQD